MPNLNLSRARDSFHLGSPHVSDDQLRELTANERPQRHNHVRHHCLCDVRASEVLIGKQETPTQSELFLLPKAASGTYADLRSEFSGSSTELNPDGDFDELLELRDLARGRKGVAEGVVVVAVVVGYYCCGREAMLLRLACLTTAVCLLYVITLGAASGQDEQMPDEKKVEEALKLVERLTETRKGLTSLKKIIADIDSDLQKTEKRTCALGGGMNGHCTAAFLNNKLHMQDWLKSGLSPGKKRAIQSDTPQRQQLRRKRLDPCFLGGGNHGYACHLKNLAKQSPGWLQQSMLSPGKRSSPAKFVRRSGRFEDLTRKRKGLHILERILTQMESDLMYEQKRNCHFNLGGHCATESAAYLADHWHYLNSPLSPGRRRRDTGLYKKLISGKPLFLSTWWLIGTEHVDILVLKLTSLPSCFRGADMGYYMEHLVAVLILFSPIYSYKHFPLSEDGLWSSNSRLFRRVSALTLF
ncbi:hypothetical protein LSH36_785g01012 [Paralvinella palmiformis]|uniref:Uncharacterized protein n=1 Tax=Paralvinella palmiformis TaxID=53620 RepID=A0AAD9MUA6_9ANNE|nr:hypothetical protein LSH36_785g01012 [Paralvinella palmiformis]